MAQKQNIHVIDHPLVRHKLGYIRDKNTNSYEFRELVKEVSRILTYEALRSWESTVLVDIETPIAKTKVERISQPPVVVSIMRAGNGMLDAVLSMIPFASAGFIGIYRDKFIHNTVEYYFKMPAEIRGRVSFLCDPIIATGDTAIAAIERLKSYEVGKIKILSLLISQHAMERLQAAHPDVEIYTLCIEKEMNSSGYLVPGLGDSGDRLYQTK
jgi:uracil phosphoribosyltransferase